MTPLGTALKFARVIRVYRNGDGYGFVWRWWNPLAWIIVPLMIAYAVLLQGVPETIRGKHDVGLGLSPWFIEHPERLEWLK